MKTPEEYGKEVTDFCWRTAAPEDDVEATVAEMFRAYGAQVAAQQREACADALTCFQQDYIGPAVIEAVLATPLVSETGAQK